MRPSQVWTDHALAERRADQVADRVENHRTTTAGTVAERDRPAAAGPPPAALRRSYEVALRADLSAVRVHRDAASAATAAAYGAVAVTFGEDVFLAADAPGPETDKGRRLLGHELTHVVQQRSGHRRVQAKPSDHGPFAPWGAPLPGLAVPASATAVSGIHDWDSKYATANSANNWNVFVTGHYTLQQITVADDQGPARRADARTRGLGGRHFKQPLLGERLARQPLAGLPCPRRAQPGEDEPDEAVRQVRQAGDPGAGEGALSISMMAAKSVAAMSSRITPASRQRASSRSSGAIVRRMSSAKYSPP